MKYARMQIGQRPADDLVELADSVRALAERLLRVHEGDDARILAAREAVEALDRRIDEIASAHDTPRVMGATDPDATRPYYFPGALAPRVHVTHPWMTGEQVGDRRAGRVRFDLIHEGPPGCAHGGFVAWFFDQAFGQFVVEGPGGGPTHRLEVTYRRPTPILRALDYEVVKDRVEDRKVFAKAFLRDGEAVVAEAAALFVAPREGFLPLGGDDG